MQLQQRKWTGVDCFVATAVLKNGVASLAYASQ
jgi:hypothetical protein